MKEEVLVYPDGSIIGSAYITKSGKVKWRKIK